MVRRWPIILLVCVTIAGGCGGESDDGSDASSSSEAPSEDAPTTTGASTDAAGTAIELRKAHDRGASPFASDISKPLTTVMASTSLHHGSVKSNEPGLYGSQRGQSVCTSSLLVNELAANAQQRDAFTKALSIEPDRIDATIAAMVSVVLRSDTLVVDHDYVSGRAVAKHVVLEKGTAVLVDQLGAPRIRCASGSPLQLVTAPPASPTYVGAPWAGFQPNGVITIVEASEPVEALVLFDIDTSIPFLRGLPGDGSPIDAGPIDLDVPLTADLDGDSVPDLIELAGDDVYAGADLDGDGLPDVIEELIGSDPNFADLDADGDGIPDDFAGLFDALGLDIDADGDGIPDDLASFFDAFGGIDLNGDGIPDDPASFFENFGQFDLDGDGIPDDLASYLEALGIEIDLDGDGVPDDLTSFFGNFGQIDLDGDGIPDDPATFFDNPDLFPGDTTLVDPPPEEPPPTEAPVEEPLTEG